MLWFQSQTTVYSAIYASLNYVFTPQHILPGFCDVPNPVLTRYFLQFPSLLKPVSTELYTLLFTKMIIVFIIANNGSTLLNLNFGKKYRINLRWSFHSSIQWGRHTWLSARRFVSQIHIVNLTCKENSVFIYDQITWQLSQLLIQIGYKTAPRSVLSLGNLARAKKSQMMARPSISFQFWS